MKLLHVDASILGAVSVSRELSALIVERVTAGKPDVAIAYRDLTVENPPHVTLASLPGAHPAAVRDADLNELSRLARAESDRMLSEFLDADTIVIGAPMYNFTVPTQLKAWIDRLVVPGQTFRMGENGPQGLAGGKRVIVALARGGFYGSDTAAASAEHAESLLRTALGFMGIADPEIVVAEGLRMVDHGREDALASAREAAGRLAA